MIYKLISKATSVFSKLDEHTLEVLKKSSASMIVKVVGMVVGLLVSVFLGKKIGAEGLGILNLSNKVAELLIVFTMFGFNNVIIKNVAISYGVDNRKVASTMWSSILFNGGLSVVVAVVFFLMSDYLSFSIFKEPELKIPLMLAVLMVIPQTFSRIFASGLNGVKKIWQSNLVNEALSIWVVGFGLLILHVLKIPINLVNVVLLYVLGRIVVFSSITIYWKKIFKYVGNKDVLLKPMLKTALPLLVVASTSILASNSDILMLGWLSNAREVGMYSVAARLALLVSFFLQVSNSAISPKLAKMYANNDIEEMKTLVNKVTTVLIGIAIISLVVFVSFGEQILGIWGEEFKQAYWVLILLAIGQFFNISTGCSGMLLIMCGFEKIHGYISVISVVLNLIVNVVFIKLYGAVGAAAATAITVLFENVCKLILTKNKLGIWTIPLNFKK